jgi:hypothetical protein
MLFATTDSSGGSGMEIWLALVHLAVSLGVVTAFGVVCKHAWNRHRWRMFKRSIREWMREPAGSKIEHPKLMREDDWRFIIEVKLSESYFSLFEIQQTIDLGVVTAKGIIASQLL